MKQRITVEQFQELTNEQKERLREWWISKAQIGDPCILHQRLYIVGEVSEHSFVLYRPKEDESTYYEKEDVKGNILPCPSIGQCIELLQDKAAYFGMTNMFARTDGKTEPVWGVFKPENFDVRADEPIDALWHTVKGVL